MTQTQKLQDAIVSLLSEIVKEADDPFFTYIITENSRVQTLSPEARTIWEEEAPTLNIPATVPVILNLNKNRTLSEETVILLNGDFYSTKTRQIDKKTQDILEKYDQIENPTT